LEAVSAAGVLVDVASSAGATGDVTNTHTGSDTVVSRNGLFDIGVGITVAHALACCRELGATVDVVSTVYGEGDRVFATAAAGQNDPNESWVLGFSVGIVVAISFADLAATRQRMLSDAVTNVQQGLKQSSLLFAQ
jgi:hypothetical protein